MIKLLGKKGSYHAVVTAYNGQILSSTETMKTRMSVLKNIYSQMREFSSNENMFVRDETYKVVRHWEIFKDGEIFPSPWPKGKVPRVLQKALDELG